MGRSWWEFWQNMLCWRKKWQHTLVFLPGESHGQKNLVGYSPWGLKESDTTECLSPHAPERMKWLGQSGNNTQLWMCLGVKLKSDAVKDNNNSLFNNIFSLKKLKYIISNQTYHNIASSELCIWFWKIESHLLNTNPPVFSPLNTGNDDKKSFVSEVISVLESQNWSYSSPAVD